MVGKEFLLKPTGTILHVDIFLKAFLMGSTKLLTPRHVWDVLQSSGVDLPSISWILTLPQITLGVTTIP